MGMHTGKSQLGGQPPQDHAWFLKLTKESKNGLHYAGHLENAFYNCGALLLIAHAGNFHLFSLLFHEYILNIVEGAKQAALQQRIRTRMANA